MAATKGIRLHPELRAEFEQFCRDHLLDERAVIEAWLLRFLEASAAERQDAAKRYGLWSLQHAKPGGAAHPNAGGDENKSRHARRKKS